MLPSAAESHLFFSSALENSRLAIRDFSRRMRSIKPILLSTMYAKLSQNVRINCQMHSIKYANATVIALRH